MAPKSLWTQESIWETGSDPVREPRPLVAGVAGEDGRSLWVENWYHIYTTMDTEPQYQTWGGQVEEVV